MSGRHRKNVTGGKQVAEQDWLAEQFEQNRGHLRAVAYRMLGSAAEADDAVQEAWLRLSRSDTSAIESLGGWLTTVVARMCLDILRSRAAKREESLDDGPAGEPIAIPDRSADPEQDAVLSDSLRLALLVVLDRLAPAERLAFVLHDMFAVPFEEIASMLGRSRDAVRQLASRARRRVQGAPVVPPAELSSQQRTVDAFLGALRRGDFEGLVQVLDPEVAVHIDGAAAFGGVPVDIKGAENWAKGAVNFAHAVRFVQPALVDGRIGLVDAPGGRLQRVFRLSFKEGRITEVEIIGDATRLAQFNLAVLGPK